MQLLRHGVAVAAVTSLVAIAAPASPAAAATPAKKVDCKKLKGKALIKAVLEGRCRTGRGDRGAPAGALKVRVAIEGTQTTTWSESSSGVSNRGTASECGGSGSGAGSQEVSFKSTSLGDAYVYSTDGRRLRFRAGPLLGGQVTRQGERRTSSGGPGCTPSETIADASGCGSRALRPGAYSAQIDYTGTSLRVKMPSFASDSGKLEPCPFSEFSDYGSAFVPIPAKKLSAATLLKGRAITGTATAVEHDDCATQNGGFSCSSPESGHEMDFRQDATTTLRWKVTIRR